MTSGLTGVAAGKPNKCIKHCGLYGSDKHGGMCSQCHSKEKAAAVVKRSGKRRWLSVRCQLHAVYLFSLGKQEEQANKGRCFVCSKRLPVPIECRCRRTFCSAHRFPLDHQCSYDAQVSRTSQKTRQPAARVPLPACASPLLALSVALSVVYRASRRRGCDDSSYACRRARWTRYERRKETHELPCTQNRESIARNQPQDATMSMHCT